MSSASVIRIATRIGAISLAATAGALAGFGIGRRAPLAMFAAAGDRLLGVPEFVAPDRALRLSATLGVMHHVAIVALWSVAFAILARRMRGNALLVTALAAGVVIVIADTHLPTALRFAAGAMTLAQRVVYGVILAVALGVGMRLAQRDVVDP